MNSSEELNIRKTLDLFIEGLRTLDYGTISEAFYEDGKSMCAPRGEIRFVLRDHWKEMADQARAKGKKFSNDTAYYEIRSLEIIGNAASIIIDVVIKRENEKTERFTDFYHMLKTKNKWVIVNKIFPTKID
ncbi:MAG: nuclear transport factor 2 family protein [Candidatus Hermodarchaeota archaeon]